MGRLVGRVRWQGGGGGACTRGGDEGFGFGGIGKGSVGMGGNQPEAAVARMVQWTSSIAITAAAMPDLAMIDSRSLCILCK